MGMMVVTLVTVCVCVCVCVSVSILVQAWPATSESSNTTAPVKAAAMSASTSESSQKEKQDQERQQAQPSSAPAAGAEAAGAEAAGAEAAAGADTFDDSPKILAEVMPEGSRPCAMAYQVGQAILNEEWHDQHCRRSEEVFAEGKVENEDHEAKTEEGEVENADHKEENLACTIAHAHNHTPKAKADAGRGTQWARNMKAQADVVGPASPDGAGQILIVHIDGMDQAKVTC